MPHNGLFPLPPRTRVETERTLKKGISASRELAELRGIGNLIPNQGVLIRAVILQEAKLSSEIENIVTTNDKLYRGFSDWQSALDPNTKEVLHYEQALWHGYKALQTGRPLSATLFCELVSLIRETDVQVRKIPGTQIVNDRTREAIYTPPEGEEHLRKLLHNLGEFYHNDEIYDPLFKMAIAHYQFEAIHPFSDGNGRTGRLLNILYLVQAGLLDVPVLYLSRFILENKDQYYRGLLRVTTEGAWDDWILYMLEAIEVTARKTRMTILDIRNAVDEAIEQARIEMKRGYSKELIELIFQQPYTRIQFLEAAGIAKRQTGSTYLSELERIGLLVSVKHGRERLFINHRLMNILSQ